MPKSSSPSMTCCASCSVSLCATLRAIDHTPSNAGIRASGLVDVHVDPALLHEGLATFLVSEALKELNHQGVGLVEAQTMERNTAAIG